jgi:uncharacterized protein HemY
LERACEISTSEPLLLVTLGEAHMAEREFAEAEKVLRTAIERAPDRPDAHYQLGLALTGLQRYGEAQAELQTTLKLDRNFPGANEALQRAMQAGAASKSP